MSSEPASQALQSPTPARWGLGPLSLARGWSKGGDPGRRGPAPLPGRAGTALGAGLLGVYLSVLVLLPIAALLDSAASGGASAFWHAVSSPQAVAALKLTLIVSAIVVAINALFGTLIAWVLVRDEFPGKSVVNASIDLPFALPTIVAGVVLLALYGKGGPAGIDITFTRAAVGLALLFVTLPFVVRSVQPVLLELDGSMEEAASSLGAGGWTVFRRVVLPNLTPAILSGAALSFARALGEFGSVVLISGNLPFKTEVGSVYIFNQVENDNVSAAASVSVVLLVCALIVLGAMTWLSRRG
ncbi:MAG TPA: sulfate ABC transporter permease subunit CysT, partial [Solirubrobacteraceae bacterium]|nr:sulfate ABC transporter permease subunit CysT [Solirubrobacteraceae bacterium]